MAQVAAVDKHVIIVSTAIRLFATSVVMMRRDVWACSCQPGGVLKLFRGRAVRYKCSGDRWKCLAI